MTSLTRRRFLKNSALVVGAGIAVSPWQSVWAQPKGANDALRIAIIGLNTKGTAHLKQLLELPDVRIAALCDLDSTFIERAKSLLAARQLTAFTTTDARAVMDR